LKAIYHIVLSNAETKDAFNTGFETVDLHRPTMRGRMPHILCGVLCLNHASGESAASGPNTVNVLPDPGRSAVSATPSQFNHQTGVRRMTRRRGDTAQDEDGEQYLTCLKVRGECVPVQL
jgi:hypothetical protein